MSLLLLVMTTKSVILLCPTSWSLLSSPLNMRACARSSWLGTLEWIDRAYETGTRLRTVYHLYNGDWNQFKRIPIVLSGLLDNIHRSIFAQGL